MVLDQRIIIESRSATNCLRPRELADLRCQVNAAVRRAALLVLTMSPPSKETELFIELRDGEQGGKSNEAADCLRRSIATHCGIIANAKRAHELPVQRSLINKLHLDELLEHEVFERAIRSNDEKMDELQHIIQSLKHSA
ncbi:hypothetical protein V5799_013770 [Amblyomma americanum]|uniref:Uncharacterized protein n=1 Tax=Amblyomma americanum TaxID=6943 RepID=A0AAQ4E4Z5_AMBAM